MQLNAKILKKKKLATKFKCTLKELNNMKRQFFPGVQGWLKIHKSINMTYHINKIKDKNHMVILIDSSEKTQCLFIMIPHFILSKYLYGKLLSNIILNGDIPRFFPKAKNKPKFPFSAIHSIWYRKS